MVNTGDLTLFLSILILPFYLLSLAVLIGNKDVIYRRINYCEGIAKVYTWTIILPIYYSLVSIFVFEVMVRYYLVGMLLFVFITLAVLYVIGAIKGNLHIAVKVARYDYALVGILATIYLVFPACVVLFKEGISVSAVIYFTTASLYFGYSFNLLRKIHRNQEHYGAQKRCK